MTLNTKRWFQTTTLTLLTLLCLTFTAWMPTSTHTTNAVLDRVIQDEIIKQNLPGVAVGVIKNGKIIYTKGFGYTDLEKKTKVTTTTPYRWASISKTLTAVAALQLDERKGNFSISDKVNKHVPYWHKSKSDNRSRITLKHLLSNRSGIQHYGKGRDENGDDKPDKTYKYNAKAYRTDRDGYNAPKAVAVFKNAKIDFNPGTKYLYSTFGFNLLGAAVEEASGGSVQWIKNNIGRKLGMSSLKVSKANRTGYQKGCDGSLKKETIGSVEWKLPGGGWESNVRDLAKFAKGIMDEKLLDNTSRLWTSVANNGTYAYGIRRNGSGSNFRVWHGGAHGNLRTLMHFFPNSKDGVVIMCWADYADCDRIAQRIYKDYFKKTLYNPSTKAINDCGKNCKGSFAGVWRKTNKDVILRRGYTMNGFGAEAQLLRNNGYQCMDFDAYTENGKVKWNGVFKKVSGQYAMWRNFDHAAFKTKFDEMIKKGYRLYDLETYTIGGKRKWAGLFKKMGGKYALWRNFDTNGFKKKREAMTKKGMKLIDVEVYSSGGKLKWSGVWTQGKGELLNRNYSKDDFGKLYSERTKKGYKIIDIECYKHKGKTYWAGIWEKSSQKERLNRNFNYCGIVKKHNSYRNQGYELIDFERY